MLAAIGAVSKGLPEHPICPALVTLALTTALRPATAIGTGAVRTTFGVAPCRPGAHHSNNEWSCAAWYGLNSEAVFATRLLK